MVRYGACHRAALRADPLASPGMTATREGRRTTSRLAFRLISQEPSDAPSAGRRRAWSREAGISCLLLLQRSSLFGHGFQRSQRLQFGVECVFQQTFETALVLAFANLNFLFHCTLHSHFQTTTRAERKGFTIPSGFSDEAVRENYRSVRKCSSRIIAGSARQMHELRQCNCLISRPSGKNALKRRASLIALGLATTHARCNRDLTALNLSSI